MEVLPRRRKKRQLLSSTKEKRILRDNRASVSTDPRLLTSSTASMAEYRVTFKKKRHGIPMPKVARGFVSWKSATTTIRKLAALLVLISYCSSWITLPNVAASSIEPVDEFLVGATQEDDRGYDTATGTQALCWRSQRISSLGNSPVNTTTTAMEERALTSMVNTERTPCSKKQISLELFHPLSVDDDDIPNEKALRAEEEYDYPIEISLDLDSVFANTNTILDDEGQHLVRTIQRPDRMAVKLLFCAVGQTGFCSPFVHDEALLFDKAATTTNQTEMVVHSGQDSSSSHVDSETTWIDLKNSTNFQNGSTANNNTTKGSSFQTNLTIRATIPTAGDYFPIVTLQFYTTSTTTRASTSSTPSTRINGRPGFGMVQSPPEEQEEDEEEYQQELQEELPPIQIRWDMANALQPSTSSSETSRVLTFLDQPQLHQVSKGVEIFSYVAIGIAACILLGLIQQTYQHKKQPVLDLSQADFLLVFLMAAFVATSSVWLLQPTSDLYCQISYPLLLIPIQLMYSITLGRLWRISAVVSPLLLEQYRKKLKQKHVWRLRLIGWLRYFFLLKCIRRRRQGQGRGKGGMRRSVSSTQLAMVVGLFTLPQIIFQTLGLIFQPQQVVLSWEDGLDGDGRMNGLARCSNGVEWYKSFLTYGYASLILLICILLVMAISSRKLPSLFNETSVIYNTTFHTLVLIVLGSVVIGITNDPDVTYLVWVAVVLSITLGSSIRLLVPKLRMVYRGETVVVSKLVSDHHRHKREKEAAKIRPSKLLENVTGLDHPSNNSWGHGSSNWGNGSSDALDYSAYDQLTPVSAYGKKPTVDILGGKHGRQSTEDETLDDSSNNFNLATAIDSAKSNVGVPFGDGTNTPPPGEGTRTPPPGGDVETNGGTNPVTIFDALGGLPFSPEDDKDDTVAPPTSNNSRIDELRNKREQGLTRQRTSRAVMTATASNSDRRKQFLKQPSTRYGRQRIVVSPDETPPRRLVLKMVDLQEELDEVNGNIMSGLVVKPEKWDAVVDLVRRLEKNFREDVVFSWHKPPLPPPPPPPSSTARPTTRPEASGSDTDDSEVRRAVAPKSARNKTSSSLARVEQEFRKVVDVRDRKYKLIMYEDVFIGAEAVDAMMYSGMASTREEAVELARRLSNERRLFKHVTNEHPFEDKYYFYHYIDRDEDSLSSMGDGEDDDFHISKEFDLSKILEHRSGGGNDHEALRFKEVVTVRDRRYRMKLYPKVFVGSEAVDAIVYHGLAKTRWEAVQLGRKLARELRLFKHVCGDHELRDEYLFYHYREDHRISANASVGEKSGDISSQQHPDKSPMAELAEAFRMYVDVRDRRFRMQSYKQTFIGSEAVDAMLYAGLATTRQEALDLGRTLQKELRLFRCVTGDRPFEDGFVFYRLRTDDLAAGKDGNLDNSDVHSRSSLGEQNSRNSGGEVMSGTRISNTSSAHTNLLAKIELFTQIVEVKDRMYHFRKYKSVFIGCEAVDAMVFHGLAETRKQAVQLGRAMAREHNLFKHVSDDARHSFADEYLFFRFSSDRGDSSIGTGSRLNDSISTNQDGFDLGDLPRISDLTQLSDPSRKKSRLAEKADDFKSCLDIRDRKYMMVTYKMCFIGSEAVDAMIFSGLVKTRQEAVDLGRTLERELRLFEHVTGDHPFSDDNTMYYRLRDTGFKTFVGGASVSGSESLHQGSTRDDGSSVSSDLPGKLELFKQVVMPLVRDRKYRMKTYTGVFVGEEAVDALIYAGFAKDRKHAVYIGREIAKEYNLFAHTHGDHAFSDGFLFYRFRNVDDSGEIQIPDSESMQQSAVSAGSRGELGKKADLFRGCVDIRDRTYRMVKYKSCFIGCEAVDAMIFSGLAENREDATRLAIELATQLRLFRNCTGAAIFEDTYSFYRFQEDDDVSSNQSKASGSEASIPRSKLLSMAETFKECTEVKDRTFRFRTYKRCFIGCNTVDALVEAGVVGSRKEAVEYGRTLARELRLFQHVTGDHAFSDDYLFFSFRVGNSHLDSDHQSISTFGGDLVGDLPVVNENDESEGSDHLTDAEGRFNPNGAVLSLPVVFESRSSDEPTEEETEYEDGLDQITDSQDHCNPGGGVSKPDMLQGQPAEQNVASQKSTDPLHPFPSKTGDSSGGPRNEFHDSGDQQSRSLADDEDLGEIRGERQQRPSTSLIRQESDGLLSLGTLPTSSRGNLNA